MTSSRPATAHVLMCADANYFQHIAACLVSLVEHNRGLAFKVVLLATHMREEANSKLLRSLSAYPDLELRIEQFDPPDLTALPLAKGYPSEIYARFWVDDFFPEDVKRVLYLDGDMVIIDSVMPLLDLDLGDNMLAAVQIPGAVAPKRLGYDKKYGYFNSGVMVLNMEKWRAEGARPRLIEAAHALTGRLSNPDQDVLNYCFYDRYIPLDYVWNAISPFYKEVNELELSDTEIRRVAREAKIVHFNGPAKPWHYLSFHPHAKEYLRCVGKTEWRDFVPKDYSAANIVKKQIIKLFGERRVGQVMRSIKRPATAPKP